MASVTNLLKFTFCLITFLLSWSSSVLSQTSYNYTINKTWNNQTTPDNVEIFLKFSILDVTPFSKALQISITAPLYNDPLAPSAPTDEPFNGLWDYEVVEAFFLGDNEEYLEIELSPSGHYLLLFLKGYRNNAFRYLPLQNYTTTINSETMHWSGTALIPGEYFPCNVQRFNAYAIHKSDPDRRYMSLYPVDEGDLPNGPDFHYLQAFQPVPPSFSQINNLCYKINQTWNGNGTDDNAEIYLSFFIQNGSMLINVNAPFYNDPPAPSAPTDEPFDGLWDYEVVEAFFLDEETEEYLEIELAPSGHYLLLYLKGYRNNTERYLPLDSFNTRKVNSTEGGQRWIGEAIIPGYYFPCNVTKFNAYAIHKNDTERRYMTLFPVTGGEIPQPDFHYLEAFEQVGFDSADISAECEPSSSGMKLKGLKWCFWVVLLILSVNI